MVYCNPSEWKTEVRRLGLQDAVRPGAVPGGSGGMVCGADGECFGAAVGSPAGH